MFIIHYYLNIINIIIKVYIFKFFQTINYLQFNHFAQKSKVVTKIGNKKRLAINASPKTYYSEKLYYIRLNQTQIFKKFHAKI